jgi:hypothetical protein
MNSNCRAYAHFVYTVAMRCVLCRCDLIAAKTVEVARTQPNLTTELSRKAGTRPAS